jgi:hypothetical protein
LSFGRRKDGRFYSKEQKIARTKRALDDLRTEYHDEEQRVNTELRKADIEIEVLKAIMTYVKTGQMDKITPTRDWPAGTETQIREKLNEFDPDEAIRAQKLVDEVMIEADRSPT